MAGQPKSRAKKLAALAKDGTQTVRAAWLADQYTPKMPTIETYRRGVPRYDQADFQAIIDTIIEDACLGHTITATCALLGIPRSTLAEWERLNPELSAAFARAREIRQRFYEGHIIDITRRGGDSTRFSAAKLGVINAGEDWRDRSETSTNVTFSLAGLIGESMKLVTSPTIEGEVVDPIKRENGE